RQRGDGREHCHRTPQLQATRFRQPHDTRGSDTAQLADLTVRSANTQEPTGLATIDECLGELAAWQTQDDLHQAIEPATHRGSAGDRDRRPVPAASRARRERVGRSGAEAPGALRKPRPPQYRADVVPYVREIMDSRLDPGVAQNTVMKSTQLGLSESL